MKNGFGFVWNEYCSPRVNCCETLLAGLHVFLWFEGIFQHQVTLVVVASSCFNPAPICRCVLMACKAPLNLVESNFADKIPPSLFVGKKNLRCCCCLDKNLISASQIKHLADIFSQKNMFQKKNRVSAGFMVFTIQTQGELPLRHPPRP